MEKGLAVSMTQPMIQSAMESLDGMREFAKVILGSGIAPHYLYEKGADGKPDFKKGNEEKLMGIFIKGDQLKMHPMTAMQEVVPVNGLLSIKGDGAKSLILNSGKIKKGSWKEVEEGSVDDGTYKVTITATREDTEETLSRSFSVAQAKRAGLWITPEMLQKNDGWKKKQSAWYKFPERMCKYRALGFLARDLFSDVLSGTYTLEEAQDYVQDIATEIQTDSGATLIIPDKQFSEDRSKKLTGNAINKVDQATAFAEPSPAPVEEDKGGIETPAPEQGEELPTAFHWTEQAMMEAKAKDLEDACMLVSLTRDALQVIPGKNTNKKLRTLILAYNAGELTAIVNKYRRGEGPVTPAPQKATPAVSDIDTQAKPSQLGPEQGEEPPHDPDNFMEPVEGSGDDNEMPPNTGFESQQDPRVKATPAAEEESIPEDTNKLGIEVAEIEEEGGVRPFQEVSTLYFAMQEKGIMNQQFDEANAKLLAGKYKDMEEFCKVAPVNEINLLLNSIG